MTVCNKPESLGRRRAIIGLLTLVLMKRFLGVLIPALALAALVYDQAIRCSSASTPAKQLPICE